MPCISVLSQPHIKCSEKCTSVVFQRCWCKYCESKQRSSQIHSRNQAGQMLPFNAKNQRWHPLLLSLLERVTHAHGLPLKSLPFSCWMTFPPLCSSWRQEGKNGRNFELTTKLTKRTLTLWWKLPGLERLFHRFPICWSFRYNPVIFCIHSENSLSVLQEYALLPQRESTRHDLSD